MKVNDTVRYVIGKGNVTNATVESISGAGKSNYKTLDLRLKNKDEDTDTIVEKVPYVLDAGEGESYWLLKGERVPNEVEEPVDESVVDTVAFPDIPPAAPARGKSAR